MKHSRGCGFLGRWGLTSLSAVLLSTASVPVWAQTNGPSGAKAVASEGFGAFEAGRYEEANEKLSLALELVGVPAMALYAARTNVKLGHWVKASELYLLASHLSPKSVGEISHLHAQHEAEKERIALLARVPSLTIDLKGEDLDSVQVTLDAEPLPPTLLGANQLVDPGHHVIRATRDGQSVTGELDIEERKHKTTTLLFARREPPASYSQTLPSIATSTATTASDEDPLGLLPVTHNSEAPSKALPVTSPTPVAATQSPTTFDLAQSHEARPSEHNDDATTKIFGWVGVGLGGVGLLVGATSGLMAASARSSLQSSGNCAQGTCTPNLSHEVDRYNSLRTWSTIGLVSGCLFTITGATLLLTSPSPQPAAQAHLIVGPASATLVGHF